jgi:hypothetical protein
MLSCVLLFNVLHWLVLFCGVLSVLPAGFGDRLAAELASLRPPGQPMRVFMSPEPLLDTWRGAAALAAGSNWNYSSTGRSSYGGGAGHMYSNGAGTEAAAAAAGGGGGGGGGMFGDPFAPGSGALTRQLYEEAGVDYLRDYRGFKYPDL